MGSVAADGFGVAWYPPQGAGIVPGEAPLVYRSERPIWGDAVWRGLADRVMGRVVVASVRNATDPMTLGLLNVHPFTVGRWSFTHNGFLSGFRTNFLRALTATLSDARYAMRSGATDTEALFLAVLDRLDEGMGPEGALRSVVQWVVEHAQRVGAVAQLNLILSDGEQVYATRMATSSPSNSLYVGQGHPGFPGAVLASEPLDGAGAWRSIPHACLVTLTAASEVRVVPFD